MQMTVTVAVARAAARHDNDIRNRKEIDRAKAIVCLSIPWRTAPRKYCHLKPVAEKTNHIFVIVILGSMSCRMGWPPATVDAVKRVSAPKVPV